LDTAILSDRSLLSLSPLLLPPSGFVVCRACSIARR
jgi:hypothetical protein